MIGEDVSSSDEDDGSGDEPMEPSTADGQTAEQSMHAHQLYNSQQKKAPIVDADGFETVQRPARRRGQQ